MTAYLDATSHIPLPWLAAAFHDFGFDANRVFLPSIAEINTRVGVVARRAVLEARGFPDKKSTDDLDVRRWLEYARERAPAGPQQVVAVEAGFRAAYELNHGKVEEKERGLREAGFSDRIEERR